ncbi:non-specific serine/threonine protein kinase [Ranunculus cassubicifolius]
MEVCKLPSVQTKGMKSMMIDLEGPYRLIYCSSKGDKNGVIQEIAKGVSPNLSGHDQRTALHVASCEGCTDIVLLLLEKGADVNSLDRWGRTPLSDAHSFCREEICKILEGHGGTDPVGIGSHNPCFEINHTEVDMDDGILIGQEDFCETYLVKWRGTKVCARTIRSCIASNHRVKTIFMHELAVWQRLHHPNIVQFLGVLKRCDRVIFLTEYLNKGSLCDILRKKGRFDPPKAVAYALDIARGMNYLHQHKPNAIMHRNLTPRNILRDKAGHLKLTDFALSKRVQEKDSHAYKMTGGTSSYRYMAPEVYRRESYGKSVDVFSFAMIVYEMLQGGPSSKAVSPEELVDKRAYEDSRPSLSSFLYPEAIRVLLRRCWHKNPELRPSFEEIITDLEIIQDNFQNACSCLFV